jgi:Fe-S-cluster-containing dehydrogenase component
MNTKAKALLIDITKCVGCRACEQACREAHGQPLDDPSTPKAGVPGAPPQPAKLTATAFTVLE